MRGLRAAALALVCVATLAGCGGDGVNSGTDPVEVEVGKTFSWDDYVVEDGWEVNGIERSAGVDQITTPEVTGTIKNVRDEERTALFQMVFSLDGDPVATVNCSAASMVEGQSQPFLCPGLNTTMPDDYDAVVVQEFTR